MKDAIVVFLCMVMALLCCNACHQDSGQGGGTPGTSGFFTYPHDGRLHAALECMTITPDETNHPRRMYMGGSDLRIAQGTHDELEACALLLGQDEDTLVLVGLDLVGILEPRVRLMNDRLEALGVDRDRILISSTHTHTGPDTIGMFGPQFFITGRDKVYQDYLVDAVEQVVAAAGPGMVPVTATFATGTVNFPGSNYPALIRDSRYPLVIDDRIHAIRFDHMNGGTVATLVNFPNHPETAIDYDWFSADYPHYLRERLVREYGGEAILFSGALGGLMTPIDVATPARDGQGHPVFEAGEPVWWAETSWERTRSYGFVLAEVVIDLLGGGSPSPVNGIEVDHADLLVPITNLELWAANLLGVVERIEFVREPGCGLLGCGAARASLVTFGDAQITTSPGETFPETILGREEVTIDFGPPWGERVYPGMEGILDHYARPLAMHFDLTGNAIGYIVPEGDFLSEDHPDYYCEYFSVSRYGETRLREELRNLLNTQAGRLLY